MEALIQFIDEKVSGIPSVILAVAWAFSISSNAVTRFRSGAVSKKYDALKKSPDFRDQPTHPLDGWTDEKAIHDSPGYTSDINTEGG